MKVMIELRDFTKAFGDVVAVDHVNLQVQEGEMVTLLGPSGCGKTTTLRCIVGSLRPDSGQLFINGRDMTDVPTHRRNVGLVFQNFALFPHMTVFENVRFPLRVRKINAGEQAEKVREVLCLVGLEGFEKRYPRELSGGQQQRVGLARAIVYEPSVLLFDEPLSNLDAKLRHEMRYEILKLQESLGFTSIYVTHDQEEALSISDRIAVMSAGHVHQIGTPKEVFDEPQTAFVADFIGTPNKLHGRCVAAEGRHATIESGELTFKALADPALSVGDEAVVFIKTGDVQLCPQSPAQRGDGNTYQGKVSGLAYLGERVECVLSLGHEIEWRMYLAKTADVAIGQMLSVYLPFERCKAFKC